MDHKFKNNESCKPQTFTSEDINSQLAMIETRQNELYFEVKRILEKIDAYSTDASSARKSVNFLKTKLNEMAKLMIELAEEVDSARTLINRRIERLSSTLSESNSPISTNGCLIWRLHEYSSKEKKSTREEIVFYSPFFYSGQHGYKFQAGARLNNTGIWKNAILISIEAHSTPWDCLLKWPCKSNVTVTLVDQNSDRPKMKHRTKVFNNVTFDKDSRLFKTFLPKSLLHSSFFVEDSILLFLKIDEMY